MLILLYKIMKKNNYKADIIEEIGPKFMIQPYNVAKLQVRESGKTVAFQHTPKKNSNNFIYAQKFMKIQSRPSSSIPQSCRQGPKTVGFTCQQPRNMGMMGSFFVNTRPNTRRVSNSLANYHAQLKRKACSESNSRKKLQSAHILNRKDSSQKTMNKKTSADLLYENVINDMNQYFSLVKLSTYKRNEKKSKPALKTGINSIFIDTTNPNISLNTNAEFMESPITEKRYMSTQIRTRQVQKQYTNMNIRALKPNNVRFSHNPRSQSLGLKNEKEKVDLTIKLITQELIPTSESKIKQTSNKRFNFQRQSPKRIPKTAITSNSLKKSQSNPKKKSSYLMEYFGKVKEIASLQQIQRFKALYYRDLIWKIWFNSGWRIKVESYSNSTIESPKYFVGRGNNSKLVKMLMGKRWWWKQETKEQNANFLWSQLKIYSAYQNQIEYEPVNVFEVDDEVQQIPEITPRTQKNNMEQEQKQIKSSQMTADLVLQNKIETIDFNIELSGIEISKFRENQKQKMQPSQEMYKKKQMQDTIRLEISPLKRSQKLELIESTKILSGSLQGQTQILFDEQWCNNKLKLNDKNVYLLTFRKYKAWESYIKNINNYKRESKSTQSLQARRLFDKNMQILDRFPNKVTNHLQYSRLIGNKKALYRTMSTYYQITKKISKFLPITYHITSGLQDQEYLKFLNEYYRRSKEQNNSMWIVKPGQMSNRGCGIKVCQDIQEIKKILKSKKTHTNGKPLTYIIQQYLRQPFLYQGRKFDIRHYIMINSTFGRIKGYWYQQGYIRTTSYKYSTKSQDSYIHLTNDAVQKYCKQYGKYQKGNKLSYEQFQKYLKALPEAKQKQYSFYDKILPKIRQISIDVINASYYIIDPKRKGNNFQIFGLDIMIDSEFRPYLIEVNTNPCLQLSSPVLAKVIPRMLDNAFAISLDPLFPPPCDVALGTKKNNLPQNYINENRFELVLDEVVEGKKLNRLYKQIKEQLSQMEGFGSDEEAYESAEDDFDAEC